MSICELKRTNPKVNHLYSCRFQTAISARGTVLSPVGDKRLLWEYCPSKPRGCVLKLVLAVLVLEIGGKCFAGPFLLLSIVPSENDIYFKCNDDFICNMN